MVIVLHTFWVIFEGSVNIDDRNLVTHMYNTVADQWGGRGDRKK